MECVAILLLITHDNELLKSSLRKPPHRIINLKLIIGITAPNKNLMRKLIEDIIIERNEFKYQALEWNKNECQKNKNSKWD